MPAPGWRVGDLEKICPRNVCPGCDPGPRASWETLHPLQTAEDAGTALPIGVPCTSGLGPLGFEAQVSGFTSAALFPLKRAPGLWEC